MTADRVTTAVTIRDHRVQGRGGPVAVRDYIPRRTTYERPLLWVHGGGWFSGSIDDAESDAPARSWAASGRRVRTVDYRLAPKANMFRDAPLKPGNTRFPAGLDDVVDVAEALEAESEHGIVLGGASAGANLAVMATLRLRDAERPVPRQLVLGYGVYHGCLPAQSRVYSELSGPFARWAFRPNMFRRMIVNYLGDDDPQLLRQAFPSRADVSGLPPTLFVHAANDRLRASGLAFAHQLRQAGVDVEEQTVSTVHGSFALIKSKAFGPAVAAVTGFMDSCPE